jgi:4a-hydroxytetrahydrobiopterin dehydratase
MTLKNQHCVPCKSGMPPMENFEEEKNLQALTGWELNREQIHKLRRKFIFKDFKEAMVFVNKVASIAEEEGHHPNFIIVYNKVELELYTHAIKGLSLNDFILAAKINNL